MTTLAEFLGGAGTQAAKGLMTGTVIDDVWKYVIDRVGAHSLDNYDKLLK